MLRFSDISFFQNPAWWTRVKCRDNGFRGVAGVHVGPVVAGIVGRQKFSFDLWGDTVNVAARLAAHGTAPGVHLSPAAWERVRGRVRASSLGLVPVKGRGEMEVRRLDGPAG